MCRRDCSTAMCWKWLICAGSVRLKTEPTPLRAVGVGDLAVREQLELLELLVDRHPRDQLVDAALDAAVAGPARGLQGAVVVARAGRCDHAASDQ